MQRHASVTEYALMCQDQADIQIHLNKTALREFIRSRRKMPSGHIADCAVFTAIMPIALRLRCWLMPHKLTRVHFSTSSHKIAANRNARIAVGGRG